MATNNHIAQLKSRLARAITQRDHWKQMAARKNMLVIVDVDPESRSTIEHIVTEDHVRAMWKRMESLAAKRDKMAGLLADVKADYTHAIHWEDLHATMKRIDAALSAGKDSD